VPEDPTPLRGGADSARARGDRGVLIHVTPAEYQALAAAARAAGLSLKAYCRRAALSAAGLPDDRQDKGWGGKRG
jgi:hypothetical protein